MAEKRLVLILNKHSQTYKAAHIHLSGKDIEKLQNLKVKA